jgi:DNA (cytosine-5)-methyltransferase 1
VAINQDVGAAIYDLPMPTSRKSKKPTLIELFAGVGGFRLGLERAGWQTVWSNQWEPATKVQHASSCYVANFGEENHSNEDIAEVVERHIRKNKTLPSADLLVGGFPCQDYSVAKSLSAASGIEGKKGVLWWEIHRLVSSIKPKLVFLENVDRLLKSPAKQRGRDFAIMLRTLGDLGYLIEWKIINAADYGFHQRRIRVFIVAIRNDLVSKPTKINLEDYLRSSVLNTTFKSEIASNLASFTIEKDVASVSESFNIDSKSSPFLNAGVYFNGQVVTSSFVAENQGTTPGKLGAVLVSDSKVPKEFWIESSRLPEWEFLKGAKTIERISATGHSYQYSEGRMAFPDSLDKPSRTILTGEGGASPSRFKHVIKTKRGYRRLVPLELERLNGFPDDWTKYDSEGRQISDTRRAFFMGNALVVGLIELVGKELIARYSKQL